MTLYYTGLNTSSCHLMVDEWKLRLIGRNISLYPLNTVSHFYTYIVHVFQQKRSYFSKLSMGFYGNSVCCVEVIYVGIFNTVSKHFTRTELSSDRHAGYWIVCQTQTLPILMSGNSMLVSQGDGTLYLKVILSRLMDPNIFCQWLWAEYVHMIQ